MTAEGKKRKQIKINPSTVKAAVQDKFFKATLHVLQQAVKLADHWDPERTHPAETLLILKHSSLA